MPENEGLRPVRRALISVSDKTGIVEFARALTAKGVEIVSTGGTADALAAVGIGVTEVSALTGFPEILDGRVKTLHPAIHAGILARRDHTPDWDVLQDLGIAPIDLVVVNLYPFEAMVARGAGFAECVENVDIGGTAMIRAAAKSHEAVAIVVDPTDYDAVRDELDRHAGATRAALRRRLAAKAFARTAAYDAAVAAWFATQAGDAFPERLALAAERRQVLRYGENPHQRAAFYVLTGTPSRSPGWGAARQLQGKELSFNNIADADAAFALACEFDRPACVIVKHANPCGAAVAATPVEAYHRALACDPVSAYGGIVGLNRPLDGATAEDIVGIFTEVVIAPDADPEARSVLAAKKNLRLIVTGALPRPADRDLVYRSVAGGLLVQEKDAGRIHAGDLKTVTRRAPSEEELADLLFAFTVAKHVRSNAIVFAKGGVTVGIGAGQMSRLDACRIAALKAADAARAIGEVESRARGSVVASDAFFPFPDGLLAAADAGATAVIQPGGSLRDGEVIAAADERGLAMVFTGMRHFRH